MHLPLLLFFSDPIPEADLPPVFASEPNEVPFPPQTANSTMAVTEYLEVHPPAVNSVTVTADIHQTPPPPPTCMQISQSNISEAFNILRVPAPKPKPASNLIRKKLPKAISGAEAIQMMEDREKQKKEETEAKERRKIEREQKKKTRKAKRIGGKNSSTGKEKERTTGEDLAF